MLKAMSPTTSHRSLSFCFAFALRSSSSLSFTRSSENGGLCVKSSSWEMAPYVLPVNMLVCVCSGRDDKEVLLLYSTWPSSDSESEK